MSFLGFNAVKSETLKKLCIRTKMYACVMIPVWWHRRKRRRYSEERQRRRNVIDIKSLK
jgi:hypothetical protein